MLPKVLYFRPRPGQSIAFHASSASRICTVLISWYFPTSFNFGFVVVVVVLFRFFSPKLYVQFLPGVDDVVCRVGPRNKIGHPARRQKQLLPVSLLRASGIEIGSKISAFYIVLDARNWIK